MIVYCNRCTYPINAKPTIIFDKKGICSGCRNQEKFLKIKVDWKLRQKKLTEIILSAKKEAKKNNSSYDCIIPVSGGKDSTFQVWYLKKYFDIKPLLVSFNHCFNTKAGNENLKNLVEKSGFDHIRFTAGIDSVRKISRYMLRKVGDLTWHYHAGIRTYPMKVAVEKKIPLVIWGEHGYAQLTGLISFNEFVEYTKWSRLEHDMRGIEAEELIGKEGITIHDIHPYTYPSQSEVMNLNLRGIYLGNFIPWDYKKNTMKVCEEMNFKSVRFKRERTFNLFSKIEDHANDIHDYLKYLKFGYGRATDDTSQEIRFGRLSREDAISLVEEYDHTEPSTLKNYCDFLGISVSEFYSIVNKQRDKKIWKKDKKGNWKKITNIREYSEKNLDSISRSKVKQINDNIFLEKNRNFWFNKNCQPEKIDDKNFDQNYSKFDIT